MTILICTAKDGQVYRSIVRASEADRWLAERDEAMSVLGIKSILRVDLTPKDVE